MKAEQLMNFVLYHSEVAFFKILPNNHYRCWMFLVDACRVFCAPVLAKGMPTQARDLYLEYLASFRTLFGEDSLVPNHHMATHLYSVLQDFGPVHSFWCFPFERLNGSLQDFPTNGINVESQILYRLMVRFLTATSLTNKIVTENLRLPRVFLALMEETTRKRETAAHRRRATPVPPHTRDIRGDEELDGDFVGAGKFEVLGKEDFKHLQDYFRQPSIRKEINNGVMVYPRFRIGSVVLTSEAYRKTTPTPLAVPFSGAFGVARYFMSVSVARRTFLLPNVRWCEPCQHPNFPAFNTVKVLSQNRGSTSFIPCSRIEQVCAFAPVEGGDIAVVIPLMQL